jgi:hypothetical protein
MHEAMHSRPQVDHAHLQQQLVHAIEELYEHWRDLKTCVVRLVAATVVELAWESKRKGKREGQAGRASGKGKREG